MNIAIGSIEEMRVSKRNIVKYLIQFKDDNGKIHKAWTNWTAKKNYTLGNSIPVKYFSIPGTFGLCCTITEVDDIPQFNEKLARIGASTLFVAAAAAGFLAAKLFDNNK